MIIIAAGATSQTIDVFIQDSTSTSGAGKTGLAYNTSGLKCYYRKGQTGTATAVTLATQTVGGAYSSGGFVEVDSTNMPGVYRLDIPNAAIDTAGFVHFMLQGATGMAPTPLRISCSNIPVDIQTIKGQTVTCSGGVTVPAATLASTTNITSASGVSLAADQAVNVTKWGGTAIASAYVQANAAQLGGQTVTAGAGVTVGAYVGNATAALTVDANGRVQVQVGTAAGQINSSSGKVPATLASTDVTGNVAASVQAWSLASITTNITGNLSGSVGSVTGAVGSVTGAVGSVTAGVTVTTNNDKTGYSLYQAFPTNFSSLSIDASGNVKVQSAIKKNTAYTTFEFMMTDSTNHAPATGKTVTCTRSLDGGAFAAGTLANVAEVGNGIYKVDFAAGDLNGGTVTLRCTASGCDDTFVTLPITP